MLLSPGHKLGPYEIVAALGAGGMGEVYKAQDTRLGRAVAVKILSARVAARDDLRQRFEREARTVSSLNHPHICALHDVGTEAGVHYFVMEYLEGESLEKRLERGALPLKEGLNIAVQVAGALDAAHRAGVIHRDLKPGNIMLTKTGAKMLDFGLAKVRDTVSEVAATLLTSLPTATQALTVEGTIMGTFQYMAPEQLEGQEADARSDIFSFGAVLYEMLTGRKAFQGKSHASLLVAIMSGEPAPLAAIQPLTPPALERLIRRCLAKDPDDRWQSARDLAGELQWIAESGSQAGVPAAVAARRRGRERFAWAAAAVLAAVLTTTLFFTVRHFLEAPPPQHQVRFHIEKPAGTNFFPPTMPAISPDGQQLAFTVQEAGKIQIFVRALNDFAAHPVPGTENGIGPMFSPDGRSLAYFTRDSLKRVNLAGGGVQSICAIHSGLAPGGTWSREGQILFADPSGTSLKVVPAGGGTPKPILRRDESAGDVYFVWPALLPDGHHFLYTSVEGNLTGTKAMVGSLDDSKFKKQILEANGVVHYAAGGYLLFVRADTLMAQSFDAGTLELKGDPIALGDQVSGFGWTPAAAISTSVNGTLVWRPGANDRMARLTWLDRSGKELGTVGEPGELANPVLSPDGNRLLITIRDPNTKTRDIWVRDLVRGTISRLTFDPADDFNPVWSPDGQYVAFSSTRKGHKDLYRKRADGAGPEEELLVSQSDKNLEAWSPDGKYLVYNLGASSASKDLYLLPLEGDRRPIPFATSAFNEDGGAISPNGRWLAYTSNESGSPHIYVQPVPGAGVPAGKWQVSTSGGYQPQWRRDGKELFYVGRPNMWAVGVKTDGPTFEAGTPARLFPFRPGPSLRNHYAVGADGQRFLMASPEAATDTDRFNVLLHWTAGLKH